MRVAVTGAGGHVGLNLVAALVADGNEVVAVDRVRPPVPEGVTWVAADVRDRAAVRGALEGVEVVYHLAAVISVAGDRGGLVPAVNVGGVRASAAAARDVGVRRFVHCSSVHAYDLERCRGEVVTESSPRSTRRDLPCYDRSKAAGEFALYEAVDAGLDAVVVNPTGIIGPVDVTPSRMGTVLRAAARGRLPATVRGAFDWVDVRDLVIAMMAAQEHGVTGRNYLIGGHSASVADLAAVAATATGARRPLADLPMGVARMLSPASTAIARRWPHPLLFAEESMHAIEADPVVDHSLATRDLGHHPRPVEETVTDLVADFARRGVV